MKKKKFPIFATIVLVFAIIWLLNDLSLISFKLPFFPVILIIISLGWIFNRFSK